MMRTLVKGIGLLFVFSFIAIVEFHIDHDSGYAIWFCLGMLIFIVVMWRVGISGLFYRLEIDRQIAENEKTEQFDPPFRDGKWGSVPKISKCRGGIPGN